MTGRKRNPDKLIARTVRNRPDVDAVILRSAAGKPRAVAKWLREACEEKAKREAEG